MAKKQTAERIGAVPRGGKPATRRIVQGQGKVKSDKRGHLEVEDPKPSGE